MVWEIPNMSYLKNGVAKYLSRLRSDKLDTKSDECFFVEYPKETIGYYFYYQSENKLVVAHHGILLENVSRKRK